MNKPSVHIIGGGLIGGSVSLALAKMGIPHSLEDVNSGVRQILESKGDIFVKEPTEDVDFVFVAAPPSQTSEIVLDALTRFPKAVITDLSSVKGDISLNLGTEASNPRYVSSHPMAGKETSGAVNADANLFADRVWIICLSDFNQGSAKKLLKLIEEFGAIGFTLDGSDHDRIMAIVSHLPQLVSYQLAEVAATSNTDLDLSGQGFKDMTRLAKSDPTLWTQIFSGNKANITKALKLLIQGLAEVQVSLENNDVKALEKYLTQSQSFAQRLPGKHGGRQSEFAQLKLRVKDEPGSLAQLFNLAASINLNIEDVSIDHVLNRPVAVVTLFVALSEFDRARTEYINHGWDLRE